MQNMKIYYELSKMIYFNKYWTDFIILVVMVYVTYSSTILCLKIVNFPLVLKTSL